MLLQLEQVQKELNLADDQKEKLRGLAEKMRGRFGDLRDLSPEERREKFQELGKETRQQVADVLKPEQLKRLRQIELQQEGPAALVRPEVAETVGLTADQKEKVEQIRRNSMEKMQSLFQEGRGGEGEQRGQRWEKAQQIRQEGEKEVMAVLTAEQKQKLRDMMGEPFELDRSQMFRPGGGRAGDRGDRRDRGGDQGRGRGRRAEQ